MQFKRHFSYCTKWASKLALICLQLIFLFQRGKNYKHIYHTPLHVPVITGNIIITLIRFACYHLLLASSSTFMTDSGYVGTLQIWEILNEYHYYLSSTKPVICQIDINCSPFQSLNMLPFHIRLGRFKLIHYSLISMFFNGNVFYQGVRNVCFSEILACFAFLKHPF